MTDSVTLTRDGAIATVTINRPEKRNAVDVSVFEGLARIGDSLRGDDTLRAVILTGAGDHFCSGIDTALFLANPNPQALIDQIRAPGDDGANLFQKPCTVWQDVPVPVIAALRGVTYGAGFQIALGADIRIGAPDLRMAIMEIKWGLIPDMGITSALPRLVRADVALELACTGRVVEADEAASLGLVTRIAADPLAEARALAEVIASKNPAAIRANKRLLREGWAVDRATGLRLEAELQSTIIGSANQIEAIMANVQKRAPVFK
ncbi:crotonase/enoyl-CoA hydratase family protein [Thalassococcus sp. CAU 1522]|uniref:Crotonase/enoyl-CoA hydratase family protein n=1 Tax=Thalassococcus arenae TaxID=2851652 RepID=A0ABS6NAR2_9RHOB|nr:crotonase/enoyl-CoA hydratase family protein [Thalassococcus arenae]MBV2361109.1 crotonase/enoyl-CoA hydratase family protein [Thalassococcus arenae]